MAVFHTHISDPKKYRTGDRFLNLRLLLQSICLRRTRALISTLEPVVEVRKLQLSAAEADDYREIKEKCKREIDIAVSTRERGKAKHTLLQSLLKLRLFCNNGILEELNTSKCSDLEWDPDETLTMLQQEDMALCAYCSSNVFLIKSPEEHHTEHNTGIAMKCSHLICGACQQLYSFNSEEQTGAYHPQCTICRESAGVRSGTTPQRESIAKPINISTGAAEMRTPDFHVRTKKAVYPSKLIALVDDVRSDAGMEKRQATRDSIHT